MTLTKIHHHHHQGHGIIFRPIDVLNVLCAADVRSVCDIFITKMMPDRAIVVNRFFMKLFQTNSIDIVNYCRTQFEFALPSTVVEKRSKKSVAKYRSCENVICKFA